MGRVDYLGSGKNPLYSGPIFTGLIPHQAGKKW